MIYFAGAGCGAADLITVRGMKLLEKADGDLCRITGKSGAAFLYQRGM